MWLDTIHVRFGESIVTMRTNDADLHRALDRAVAARRLPAADRPVNFSLDISTDPTAFHRLLWGRCIAVRTTDGARLLRALDHHVSLAVDPPPGVVRVLLPSFVRDGEALLLPAHLQRQTHLFERRAADFGWLPVDAPFTAVDIQTGEVVVSDAVILDVPSVVTQWQPRAHRRVEPVGQPGRYALRAVLTSGRDRGSWGLDPAAVVAVGAAVDEQLDRSRVDDLARLVSGVRVVGLSGGARGFLDYLELDR